MLYIKPQIINLATAVEAIQGDDKGGNHYEWAPPDPPNATASAYEADE